MFREHTTSLLMSLRSLIVFLTSGQLLLCIPPALDSDALHSVKWHPKQPDTLAVASESKIFLVDLSDAARMFRGQPVPQTELHRISQVFSVPSVSLLIDPSRLLSPDRPCFAAARCI
jgi:hypothetical protein